MTGIENMNYPVFNATAEYLEQRGHIVINPARHPFGLEYNEYMKYAFLDVQHCDFVVTLPGAEDSSGSLYEVNHAKVIGKIVYTLEEFEKCHLN